MLTLYGADALVAILFFVFGCYALKYILATFISLTVAAFCAGFAFSFTDEEKPNPIAVMFLSYHLSFLLG